MATSFKTFLNNDMVTSKTLLHEAIPLTGGLISGTYADTNIKNYSHTYFQSVYDYPYLSSSANHIFDISVGLSTGSACSGSSTVQMAKKQNMYYQMAQTLMGYGFTPAGHPEGEGRVVIRSFDKDGLITTDGNFDDVIFLNFSRLLTKDEIQKGTFSMTVLTGGTYAGATINTGPHWLEIRDTDAQSNFFINSPAGEYGILKAYASGTNGHTVIGSEIAPHTPVTSPAANHAEYGMPIGFTGSCGLIFYQAGIAVLTSSIFNNFGGPALGDPADGAHGRIYDVLSGSSITGAVDNVRSRIKNISFNNTTELNSTVYFCRANHNEFNYSSNPTYVSSSQLVVKKLASDMPVSYITTIGLYSADNELLAVAKLSEPIRKDPTTELNFRVRLDY